MGQRFSCCLPQGIWGGGARAEAHAASRGGAAGRGVDSDGPGARRCSEDFGSAPGRQCSEYVAAVLEAGDDFEDEGAPWHPDARPNSRNGADGPLARLLLRAPVEESANHGGSSPSSSSPSRAGSKEAKRKVSKKLTQQAAGHGGGSLLQRFGTSDSLSCEVPSFVMKAYDEAEAVAYQEMDQNGDVLLRFTPQYFGDLEPYDLVGGMDGSQELQPRKRYMKLSNLLSGFTRRPHVMDCKVGCRSFKESEVTKQALRGDLYQRLVGLDPSAPTPEERQAQACTKYRWMDFNDTATTLRSLGFRIDGIAHTSGKASSVELRSQRTLRDTAQCIVKYFLPAGDCLEDEAEAAAALQLRVETAQDLLDQLQDLRTTATSSQFVRTHSIIGASLLFIADAEGPGCGVHLIDFANVVLVPEGESIDHRSPWRPGNHEDGLLTGIDNMIRCWEEVLILAEDAAKQGQN